MNGLTKTVALGATMLGLGALTGVAVSPGHDNISTAARRAPVEVRTQVIRRTIRIHRRARPAKQPPAHAAPPPAPLAAPAPQPVVVPQAVATPPAAVAPHKPIRTRTSGAAGGVSGGEHEHESGRDD